MEGRYPTGDANLSTSSLAYGGYRLAARLAQSLGKPAAAEFDQRAEALRKAIESYFGAEVEGFKTYRYYKENTTLRGWILLPLAMGITERQDATVAALISDKLWPNRMEGGRYSGGVHPARPSGAARPTMPCGSCSKPAAPRRRST